MTDRYRNKEQGKKSKILRQRETEMGEKMYMRRETQREGVGMRKRTLKENGRNERTGESERQNKRMKIHVLFLFVCFTMLGLLVYITNHTIDPSIYAFSYYPPPPLTPQKNPNKNKQKQQNKAGQLVYSFLH